MKITNRNQGKNNNSQRKLLKIGALASAQEKKKTFFYFCGPFVEDGTFVISNQICLIFTHFKTAQANIQGIFCDWQVSMISSFYWIKNKLCLAASKTRILFFRKQGDSGWRHNNNGSQQQEDEEDRRSCLEGKIQTGLICFLFVFKWDWENGRWWACKRETSKLKRKCRQQNWNKMI